MPSAIDITVPVHGNPTTQSVRDNFETTKNELNNMETLTGAKINRSGDEMRGFLTLFGNPTQNYHAANMSWVLSQIKSTTNSLVYIGDYDAAADRILTSGQPQFIVGTALPLAGPQNSQFYFTAVTSSATAIGNQPVGGVAAGTWLISNGESWTDFAMAAPGVTAQTVPIAPPIANISADNVYDALTEIMGDIGTIESDAVSISRGGTMQAMLTLFADPVNLLDPVTKQYADAKIFADAPSDANSYGRKANAWTAVLPMTGGTLTGDLRATNLYSTGLFSGSGGVIDGPVANERDLWFKSNGSSRWYFAVTGAEQGGDAGGFFSINYCNDGGNYKNGVLFADRLGNLTLSPTTQLTISAPSTTFQGSLAVGNNKTISTGGELLAGFGAFGKPGSNRGGFIGSWNPVNNNYFGIWTENTQINFGASDLAGNVNVFYGGMSSTLFSAQNAIYAGTSITSNNGRIISHGTGNPAFCCWDGAQGYAAGMFIGGGKNLYFGSMDGSGSFVGPALGYFNPSGDLSVTRNIYAGNGLFAQGNSNFGIFYGNPNYFFSMGIPNYYQVLNDTTGAWNLVLSGVICLTSNNAGDVNCARAFTSGSNLYAGGNGVYYPSLGGDQHGISFYWTGTKVNMYVDNNYVGQITTTGLAEDEATLLPEYNEMIKRLDELTARVAQLEAA